MSPVASACVCLFSTPGGISAFHRVRPCRPSNLLSHLHCSTFVETFFDSVFEGVAAPAVRSATCSLENSSETREDEVNVLLGWFLRRNVINSADLCTDQTSAGHLQHNGTVAQLVFAQAAQLSVWHNHFSYVLSLQRSYVLAERWNDQFFFCLLCSFRRLSDVN